MPPDEKYRLPPIVGEGADAETRWQGDMTRSYGLPAEGPPAHPQTLREEIDTLRNHLSFERSQRRARVQMARDDGREQCQTEGHARA